ncbi:hypothetical protein A5806_002504 [Enterococcus faecium]|uniref:hypothetical protein n=1 Tax=Enterococcus faecium TaxID=1352 RepID=UPI000B3EDEC6|nr:hypothetical protein [Enterococcus faecium]OUZ27896.1 hypothetical protein A5806_002504 [Enterococcus faecium]
MLNKKLFKVCATTMMGLVTLGGPSFLVHADVQGQTNVTYNGNSTTVKPKDWAISVPSTIDETKEGKSENISFKYGIGKLAIVDEKGNNFEDSSSDRTFSMTGNPNFMGGDGVSMIIETTDYKDLAWLYSEKTDQGATEPTSLTDQLNKNNGSVKDIQNIEFSSKASGNTASPLVRYVTFGSPMPGYTNHPLDLNKSYSNTISWTATEKK